MTAVREEKIDLIILEPANGNEWVWDFLDALKQDDRTQSIPVIFCTVIDERKQGMEKGADAYLLKPVYANVLHQYVQDLLEKQEVHQAK
jgi:CheY-like chemotaxis protein